MKSFEIKSAETRDEEVLCDIFMSHINAHNEYISHGEIQMGVGQGIFRDGEFITRPSPRARENWLKYIHGNIVSHERAAVFKAVSDGGIEGFCVTEIMEDGAEPFGMVCDVLVKETSRGSGMGSALLSKAVEWLRSRGVRDIYLESGVNNHPAHEYFMRRGFRKISEIYKLSD